MGHSASSLGYAESTDSSFSMKGFEITQKSRDWRILFPKSPCCAQWQRIRVH